MVVEERDPAVAILGHNDLTVGIHRDVGRSQELTLAFALHVEALGIPWCTKPVQVATVETVDLRRV